MNKDTMTLTLPADGRSAYLDFRMPYAWEAKSARLTLVAPIEETVADYAANPLHLVRGSVATPKGGVRAKVLSEAQFLAGEDARGTMVALEPETFPRKHVLAALLDRGALGFVTDFTPARFERPDEVPDIVGATENDNPEADCQTRDFVGFAVSPRMGVHLRTLAAAGNLFARVECDARRYAGEIALDPATLPAFETRRAEARPAVSSPWRDYAEGVVARRLTEGAIRDQVKVPKECRVTLPAGSARGVFESAVSNMDGAKSLGLLIREAESGLGVELAEADVKRVVLAVEQLGDWGYFAVSDKGEIGRADIVAALRRIGIVPGDVLLVHSSLSAFGHIAGGAETAIQSLMEAVGPEGTVLMPSFLRNECMLNGVNKRWDHRPMDRMDYGSAAMKWIGTLPMEFLRLHADIAVRGTHASHPWCGFGPKAAEMVTGQRPDEPPASDSSALAKAVEFGGKILHFGSPVGHTTFLHYLEDHFDLPGIGPGYYAVRRPDGSVGNLYIPKHLPGPREFYVRDEKARFFREAMARGLEIRSVRLGLGELKLMDCRTLWRIGSELVREDPRIIIGDL